jgi:hypothetical protein
MMIKLQSLLKENTNEMAWWLDPQGNLHRVPQEGHSNFAKDFLNTQGVQSSDSYGSMYDLGWVRLTFFGYMGQYAVHFNLHKGKRPSSLQKDVMVDIAKQYGGSEIIDDTNGGVLASADDFWE